jgi:hypothetical protein
MFIVNRMVVRSEPKPDRLVRWSLVIIAAALAWQAIHPRVIPRSAEAGREALAVNLERVGGRYLTNGILPVRCGDLKR